ncbi:MAG: nickel pincer cofactor biosynthesis protein LarC [Oscillospiraceae bacterium]|nr:nickel pincer cofactor biosynthesis protein LarC [Oscillospiraceae bacterium]
MKTLYLDLGMGAAGDMLAAALMELLPEPRAFLHRLNSLGIPRVAVSLERAEKCGIQGTRFRVSVDGEEEDEHHHHHHHSGLHGVEHIVEDLHLEAAVEADVLAVYRAIAEAESAVHGVSVEEIHFHEVGTLDAIADVTAVCLLMHELGADEVVASPVHVGAGTVRCAHGVLPVPAPATALLLRGVPIYGGAIQSELCTPTGAALLRHFVTRFGDMPLMTPEKIGYGLGKKDFERANCLRAILGETAGESETIVQLQCNVDDMTGEALGFAMERLYEAGAVEVFTAPVGMKKNRPGVLLTALCHEAEREAVVAALLRHTTTLGVREQSLRRHVLARRVETVETPLGALRVKIAEGGVTKRKWEYDDLARAARERGLSLAEAERLLQGV